MDEGEVIYEGQKVQIKGPLDALHRGIAMVHQELQPIPERSIGISTLHSADTALAISTSCIWDTLRLPSLALGSKSSGDLFSGSGINFKGGTENCQNIVWKCVTW